MRALTAAELLTAWERGLDQPPLERALIWLEAVLPETSRDELAQRRIGWRDARLLDLREQAFGPHLSSVAACPRCGESLELTFDVADIRAEGTGEADLSLTVDSHEVQFRLPNTLDLMALDDAADARAHLLERCVLSARRGGEPMASGEMPPSVADAIARRMAEADPQADVQLDLCCPACEHQWQVAFDVAAFFGAELDAWARRTMGEVGALAKAYGWREADILALSARRRQMYLEMANP